MGQKESNTYAEVELDEGASELSSEKSSLKSTCLNKRCAGICLGCLVVLPILFVFVGLPALNVLVRHEIAVGGSRALGSPTSVDAVSLGIINGRSKVTNAVVVNPVPLPGRFVHVENVVVAADLWSCLDMGPYLHFPDLAINTLHISVSEMQDGKTNAQVIIDHIKKFAKAHKSAVGEQVKSYIFSKKMMVDRIQLTDIEFSVDMPPMTKSQHPAKFKIKDILIKDIGTKQQGVYMYELVMILLQSLLSSLVQTVGPEFKAFMVKRLLVGFTDVLDYGPLHVDVGQGMVTIGKAMETVTNGVSKVATQTGNTLVNIIESAVNKTENAIEKPVDKALSKVQGGASEVKAFHKMVSQPFGVFHKMAGAIKNVTEKASDIVSGAGDKAGGVVTGLGSEVASGKLRAGNGWKADS